MKLSEVAVVALNKYVRHREFNITCAHVASHFTDYVQGMESGPFRKIEMVAQHESQPDIYARELRVATITRFFDFSTFWSSSRRSRQEMVLDFLVSGTQIVANHEGWNPKVFVEAGDRVRDDEFFLGRFVRRLKASPNRKLRAGVWFEVDDVRAVVEVRVLDRSGHIVDRHAIAETEPVAWWYVPYLGDIHWIDSSSLEVRRKGAAALAFPIALSTD